MKVLLINPPQYSAYGKITPPSFPPIGLAYLASSLEKAGHQALILDISSENSLNNLHWLLSEYKPSLVGITCTTPAFYETIRIAEVCKARGCCVVIGGPHPTIMPTESVNAGADFIIRGEGEYALVKLADELEKERSKFSLVPNLAYKKGSKMMMNKRKIIRNLDSLPFPAWHLFKNFKYNYPDAMYHPAIPIITSRGCPGRCTFCCTRLIFGKSYRFRDTERVIEEIRVNIATLGAREIHIWDDNFLANKQRVYNFCKRILEEKLHKEVYFSIPQGIRADSVDERTLKMLKSINVYSLGLGLESGCDNVLRKSEKNISVAQIKKAVKLAKRFGFETWAFFIMGLLGDTEDSIKKTIELAKEVNPDLVKFLILKPFPGTKVFNQLKKKKLIIETDYRKYGFYTKPVHNLPGLSSERIAELQKQAYKEFYIRPSKIISEVKRTKSWTRLKLNIKALNLIKHLLTDST